MKYIETLTDNPNERLSANKKRALIGMVANSKKPQHRGKPDSQGFIPYIVIDPSHCEPLESDSNICVQKNADASTLVTAFLSFPHIPLKNNNNRPTIRKIVKEAFVNYTDALSTCSDDDLEQIMLERERLRMRAINPNYDHSLDSKEITTNKEEKILINATRAAIRRREGNITLDDVKKVLSFKRNNFQKHLSFPIEELSPSYLYHLVTEKTCAPPIPKSESQKKFLLYKLNNPNAGLSEIIEETGVNRGRFETFRLNLPELDIYSKEYIESLEYDMDKLKETLKSKMKASPHPIYDCSECSKWAYSARGLSGHKTNSKSHEENAVINTEIPSSIKSTNSGNDKDIKWDNGNITVSEMLSQFSNSGNDTETESVKDAKEIKENLKFNFLSEADLKDPDSRKAI